ncbi:MAG: helix-turn-helix transcriptional regulator [bacterium]|nr:helix-turn-helix transcriptional regulator [bacterium]
MKSSISELRRELGLTQEQLAISAGVTRQTIISLEQGRYNPSLGLAYAITRALKRRAIEDVFHLP